MSEDDDKSHRDRTARLAGASLFLAAGAIGGLSGYLTSTAGSPNVIAAAVSAIIFGIGGVVIVGHQSDQYAAAVGILAIIFSVTFLVALEVQEERQAAKDLRALEEARALREADLQWCSQTQFRLNLGRDALGLPPLSNDTVCGTVRQPLELGQER